MFDTTISLTSAVAALLCARNSQLTVLPATTAEDFAARDAAILRRSRLIAFPTPVIMPRKILDFGPIVDAVRPIVAGIHVLGLEGLAYGHLAQLFWQLAKALSFARGAGHRVARGGVSRNGLGGKAPPRGGRKHWFH